MAGLTPMKAQYNEIKSQYQDCLLFFRLGDFYEMFGGDAITASRELDIALTTRDKSADPEDRTPMCGVPYHSSEAYIARLIQKGYKVAVCEQTEDPAKAKGLVEREVVRVITPGTVTESSMLEEGKNNYIASVFLDSTGGAACFADVSTGEFCLASFDTDAQSHIVNELSRFSPRETVLSPGAMECAELIAFLHERLESLTETDADFDFCLGSERVCEQFGVSDIDSLGLGETPSAVCAAGGLLSYLKKTQKLELSHINKLDIFTGGRYMEMDHTTRRNLELTESMRLGEKKGSLLWVLDHTRTPMGGRLLRSWVERPLLSPVTINRRNTAVSELFSENIIRAELNLVLREIGDIGRLAGKAAYGTANGRDILMLGVSLSRIPELTALLRDCKSPMLKQLAKTDGLESVWGEIFRAICDEPPFSVRDGGILREGFNEEVDYLRSLRNDGTRLIAELEARERESTGIKKLKIGYNRVFGYYIDIPRSYAGEVPPEYIRKQTLVSNERYFTEELKELENSLATASERVGELEYELFTRLRESVAGEVARIQQASAAVAELDCLCSLAEAASRNGYVCPEVLLSHTINIKEGRHPVVEKTVTDTLFVPNDTFLNNADDLVAIVTGPNMAGKSTYMRQTALIVLMAQIGSFVPAKSASIGVIDRVFTRIGAADDLASGRSTFMVEMTEMAAILREATSNSLLILDEIGRGTSTYDGMAIARAVLEYCASKRKLGAKTMFATHYHELTALEGELTGVRNYNIRAKKQGGDLVFLRKIVPGAADESYGIEVAKLAGIPDGVVARAKQCLKELESDGQTQKSRPQVTEDGGQIALSDLGAIEAAQRLRELSPDTLTPIEALGIIYELKKKVEA